MKIEGSWIWKRSWNSLENHDFSKGSFCSWKCFKKFHFSKIKLPGVCFSSNWALFEIGYGFQRKIEGYKISRNRFSVKSSLRKSVRKYSTNLLKIMFLEVIWFSCEKGKKIPILKNQVVGSMFCFELSIVWDWVWLCDEDRGIQNIAESF